MPADKADGELTFEKSPSYFKDEDVPSRVGGLMPEVKIILILRDPVDR